MSLTVAAVYDRRHVLRSTKNRRSQTAATVGLLILMFALPSFAQSVADVARAERERRKTVRSKVLIISTETTANSTGTSPEPAASTPAAATAAAKPAPAGPTDNKGRDEKSWRTAFQQARDDAKRAEARVLILDLRIKQLNTDMLQSSGIYNREYRLGPDLAAAQKELEEARKAAEQAKKKIDDLEEELRRSGGPAGWAR